MSGPWSDDELAAMDVVALLRDSGVELRGEGLVAAAVQLERAGTVAGDVLLSADEVRAGDVLTGEPPSLLDRMVGAGAEAEWLEHVAELMMQRAAAGGSP